jgi:hypothetical protein
MALVIGPLTGNYDGTNRAYFFPRVAKRLTSLVEAPQKLDREKKSYQRDSEGKGKSITKALNSSYFLALTAHYGAN